MFLFEVCLCVYTIWAGILEVHKKVLYPPELEFSNMGAGNQTQRFSTKAVCSLNC